MTNRQSEMLDFFLLMGGCCLFAIILLGVSGLFAAWLLKGESK
jgi:hypothetical protein